MPGNPEALRLGLGQHRQYHVPAAGDDLDKTSAHGFLLLHLRNRDGGRGYAGHQRA